MEPKQLHNTITGKIISSNAELKCPYIFLLCRIKSLVSETRRPAKIGTQKCSFVARHAVKEGMHDCRWLASNPAVVSVKMLASSGDLAIRSLKIQSQN